MRKTILLTILITCLIWEILPMTPWTIIPKVEASPDISDVGTSTSQTAVQYSMQRKTFYASGRYWVFYFNGSSIIYKTSIDGISWSDETHIVDQATSYFSTWFNGTYFHYVSISPSQYRMGTPNTDGTITWSTTVQNPALTGYQPTIIVDSNGYPWIGWHDGSYPKITKSKYNNGTWSTESGFPYTLNSTSNSGWDIHPVPLTNGKVYCVYASGSTGYGCYGKLWNGTVWGSVETVHPLEADHGLSHSIVAINDDVHLLYKDLESGVGRNLKYRKRTYSTGTWGNESTFSSYNIDYCGISLSKNSSTEDLYAFWTNTTSNHIYYKKYTNSNSTWGSTVDWITETTLSYRTSFSSFYQVGSNTLGIAYTIGSESPYTVRFATLGTTSTETKASGIYNLRVHVTANTFPYMEASVLIEGQNKTTDILGDARFQLPFGVYDVTVFCGDLIETREISLNRDMSIGFNFDVPIQSNRGFYLIIILPLSLVLLAFVFLVFWRKK